MPVLFILIILTFNKIQQGTEATKKRFFLFFYYLVIYSDTTVRIKCYIVFELNRILSASLLKNEYQILN